MHIGGLQVQRASRLLRAAVSFATVVTAASILAVAATVAIAAIFSATDDSTISSSIACDT